MRGNFIATECNFQGESGYMVLQIHDGREVAKQFVSKSCYKEFCEAIGVEPEIKD